ncbi:MAG: hypothetical protein RIT81_14340 [Deltaproteobacteria bacterium]
MFARWLGVGSVVLVSACSLTVDPPPQMTRDPMDDPVEGPTYYQDVRPLLADNCGGCHLPDGIAPFSFDEYEETQALAGLIANVVETRRMPPWGAHDTQECQHDRPFKDDLRLSQDQIDVLKAWAANGAPEGEVPATVEPFSGKLSALPRVDATLTPASSFSTSGTQDQFRCFVLDPAFDRGVFLRGLRFAPGNDKVVHHAIVYADATGTAVEALADENGQYDCFGGPGFDGATLVGAWAPGGIPAIFPEGSAMPLAETTKFALQIHYHPIGAEPEEDRTSVELMFETRQPEYLAAASFIGNFSDTFNGDEGLLPGPSDDGEPRFFIPAGAKGHTETMRLRIPFRLDDEAFEGAYLHASAAHMHYVGTDMKIAIRRGSQSAPCGAADVADLEACIDTACPDAAGFALAQCIEGSCGDQLETIPAFCGSCLQHRFLESDTDIFGTCKNTMPMPTELYGAIADQPAEECLLQTPAWDFEWQRFYEYDVSIAELPFVRPGDTFELRCTYDNSMDNPFVREALDEQGLTAPRDVVLGEETLDEMCLLAVTFLYKE